MARSDTTLTSVFYANGWLAIREEGNSDGWIATDAPMSVQS
ncbi:MAG: hypothetical protein ACQETI_07085 [Halobacteriota archaeon]